MKKVLSTVVAVGNNPIAVWVNAIRNYFVFLHVRRLDERYDVWPVSWFSGIVIIGLIGFVLALLLIVDPIHLEWVKDGKAHEKGWFAATTDIGKSNWILWLSGFALFLLSFFRAERFSRAGFITWHRVFLNFYFVFTTVAFSGLLALLFKNLIGRARPFAVEGLNAWHSIPFYDNYEFASFPSGHSTTAGAMTAAIVLLFPRFGWLIIPLGVWIALSRVMIGVHFPSDAFAGLMFGIVFTWIYARSFARKRLLFRFDGQYWLQLRGER